MTAKLKITPNQIVKKVVLHMILSSLAVVKTTISAFQFVLKCENFLSTKPD